MLASRVYENKHKKETIKKKLPIHNKQVEDRMNSRMLNINAVDASKCKSKVQSYPEL